MILKKIFFFFVKIHFCCLIELTWKHFIKRLLVSSFPLYISWIFSVCFSIFIVIFKRYFLIQTDDIYFHLTDWLFCNYAIICGFVVVVVVVFIIKLNIYKLLTGGGCNNFFLLKKSIINNDYFVIYSQIKWEGGKQIR